MSRHRRRAYEVGTLIAAFLAADLLLGILLFGLLAPAAGMGVQDLHPGAGHSLGPAACRRRLSGRCQAQPQQGRGDHQHDGGHRDGQPHTRVSSLSQLTDISPLAGAVSAPHPPRMWDGAPTLR